MIAVTGLGLMRAKIHNRPLPGSLLCLEIQVLGKAAGESAIPALEARASLGGRR